MRRETSGTFGGVLWKRKLGELHRMQVDDIGRRAGAKKKSSNSCGESLYGSPRSATVHFAVR